MEDKGVMDVSESKEKLTQDLKAVAKDAEELLRATAGDISERTRELRARLTATLESAKATCVRLEESAIAGARATDKVIRENPYQAVGVAFGVGLLLGFLIKRK